VPVEQRLISADLDRRPEVAVAAVVVTPILTRDALTRLSQRLSHGVLSPEDKPDLNWAAVAVVLTHQTDSILLIRRAERTGDPWSGHMALPGGRRQEGEDLLATVIRECWEEVGFRLSREQLAGSLPDVVPRTPSLPPLAIRPFVFVLPSEPRLALNSEVASASWVPLQELVRPYVHRLVCIELPTGPREFEAYHVAGAVVWGLTERILTTLLAAWL
jgi:8-oxo-dGTP pyrophosphatase MutT (NUDIX family)